MAETSGENPAWLYPTSGFPGGGAFSIALRIQQALTAGRESAWATLPHRGGSRAWCVGWAVLVRQHQNGGPFCRLGDLLRLDFLGVWGLEFGGGVWYRLQKAQELGALDGVVDVLRQSAGGLKGCAGAKFGGDDAHDIGSVVE